MAKFTPAYLKKLEDLLKEQSYEVRYEKGNFRSNYCILEAKKVVVINKFSTLESRIQALMEIVQRLTADGQIHADLRQVGLNNPIRTMNDELDFEASPVESILVADDLEIPDPAQSPSEETQ
ncbi:hypothetical protein BH11BAC2_BH11BAC2_19100 [soil metagenome]